MIPSPTGLYLFRSDEATWMSISIESPFFISPDKIPRRILKQLSIMLTSLIMSLVPFSSSFWLFKLWELFIEHFPITASYDVVLTFYLSYMLRKSSI